MRKLRLGADVGLFLLFFGAHAWAQDAAPESFTPHDLRLALSVDYSEHRLAGSITYELTNWTAQPAGEVSFLLNRLMEASSVTDGEGSALRYSQDVLRFHDDPMRQVNQLRVTLLRPIPPGGSTTIRIDYAGNLVGYTEVGWLYVKDRVDTAFTIIREDALAFPALGGLSDAANRRRPRTPFTYDASIRVPSGYLVATGGKVTRTPHADGTATWRYVSGKPSPFLNVMVAPFDTIVAGGVRIFYLHADSVGARRVMANTQSAMRLLSQWFGPLHGEWNLAITEIPDGWGSQANLVGGIIQTASAFRDPRRLGELYHELSHLWNAPETESPSPRWNEGLASFLQDMLRERVDGWTGRREGEAGVIARVNKQVSSDSTLRTVPFIDYGKRGMTDYSYSVGELMFATLYDLVGEAQFNAIVGGHYQKFVNGATTRDLVALARTNSSRDLTPFFNEWIFTTGWTKRLAKVSSMDELGASYSRP
jgi:hypothetical protein